MTYEEYSDNMKRLVDTRKNLREIICYDYNSHDYFDYSETLIYIEKSIASVTQAIESLAQAYHEHIK